ncbi:hypothetical protein C1645_826080 [Glomus cerebriforme]|uniref:G-protein coupled receptors family 1 profile domain-containing protein n=1 Tax=Glomus cerebriforme TaxID=658196 RepID=A0A397SRJ5_9GLOM|nr:hypothetical protein C1645_826080 [Glomus cerebriforme]
MPLYSTAASVFIALQIISLLLILCLIVIILSSNSHFAKWTLIQVCISAFGCGFTNLPLIIMYGDGAADGLIERAFETPWCIILQKVSLFFLFPLEFFCCALAFYLWYALVKRDFDIEKKYCWLVSTLVWSYTTIYNGILLEIASRVEHWGVFPGSLNCKTSGIIPSFYGYVVPTSIIVLLAVLMSLHSAYILRDRWSHFYNAKNRTTAIRLGEVVRLFAWSFTFVVLLTLPLIPRVIQNESQIDDNYYIINIAKIANFGAASTGTLLFLIFGTNRKAAYFLPCYYAPPNKVRGPLLNDYDNYDNPKLTKMPNAYFKKDNGNYYKRREYA